MLVSYNNRDSLVVGQVLYAFRTNVGHSTHVDQTIIGPITEVTCTMQSNSSYVRMFRKKKDGTFFKKETCLWSNRIYTSLTEAEDARKECVKQLREQLTAKIDSCQKLLSTL